MSGDLLILCVFIAITLAIAAGAFLFGRKVAHRRSSVEFAEKIDKLEMNLALLDVEREDAECANLAKSVFLANMSHELRTPLNGILGLTDILCSEDLTQAQRRKIDLINGSSETLLNLLNDILDISKIEAGSIDFENIDIELHSLMRDIYEFWQPIAVKKKINLLFQKQKNMPNRLVTDPTRIRQCLNNLINNALKFTPEGGQVSVKVKVADVKGKFSVSISVQDTGLGINPEDLSKLFKPFSQAEANTSRKFGGTGLGLAITKNLCELMGGNVLVRSEAGVGTIFSMSFRAEPSTAKSRQIKKDSDEKLIMPRTNNLNGVRCLIVEDNAVNLEVLRLLLEPCDLTLVETTNGQEAINALEEQFFDVVLMDLQMPILGGKEAVKIIRNSGKHYAKIPIVAMTANAMDKDKKECFELGFSAFLTKPLKRSELISTIDLVANLHVNSKMKVA